MKTAFFVISLAMVLSTMQASAYDVPLSTSIISSDNGPLAIAAATRQGEADAKRDIRAGKFRILLLDIVWQDERLARARSRYRLRLLFGPGVRGNQVFPRGR